MGKKGQRPRGDGGVGLRPGQIVADRYRIHRLLGKGGMGEVYRADDLALGRYVALKFPRLDGTAGRAGGIGALSQRLAAEVAVAQQVSHPNVCRVHELGRHDGGVFLSMQLIEGESLRTILDRTVGTLTGDEKLRIAHDLCAALAAIHDQGVLYRDLKPGNVMVDSDGRALIMDFGLAACGIVTDPGSGTFDYMAPEQLAGGESSSEAERPAEPSVPTDLYALGLVLFELFAGAPAFAAVDRRELVERKRRGPPEFPSPEDRSSSAEPSAEPEIAPDVREVILRCLAPDPEDRPATAEEVAAALPRRPGRGSSPGERWVMPSQTLLITPRWRPRPGRACLLLAGAVLALAAVAALAPAGRGARLMGPAERGEPPRVLEVRARDAIAAAGLEGGEPGESDTLSGYAYDLRQLDDVSAPVAAGHAAHDAAPDRWAWLADAPVPPVVFWYRQSPTRLTARGVGSTFQRFDDPPLSTPGMVGVQLDPRGRLLRLDAVPPRVATPGAPGVAPDWSPLFAAAGLEPERFRPVAPSWTPPEYADRRWAWVGPDPASDLDAGAETVRIEAASFEGTPVSFRRVEPWMLAAEPPARPSSMTPVINSRTGRALAGLWFAGVLVFMLLLARRHLFRRVADRTAAFRLAVAVLAARALVWFVGVQHLPGSTERLVLNPHLARAMLAAAVVWIIYVALEPLVRRFWPDLTASWVRLVYGRVGDPLVGYHLLVGVLFGTGAVLWSRLYGTFAGSLGLPAPRPDALDTLSWLVRIRDLDLQCEALRGLRQALAMEIYALVHGVLVSLFAVVGVVLLRLLLKKPVVSRSAALAVFVAFLFPSAGHPVADLVVTAVACGLWLTALIRFGFLTAATATACAWMLNSHPLTLDLSAWYAPGSVLVLLSVLALALYGFKASLAGCPPLPAGWWGLDDSPAAEPS